MLYGAAARPSGHAVAAVAPSRGRRRLDRQSAATSSTRPSTSGAPTSPSVYAALTGLDELQRHALDLWYRAEHGSTIDAELEDELSDAELDRARDLMRATSSPPTPPRSAAPIEGAGTDEEEIYRALRNKTAEERSPARGDLPRAATAITLDDDLEERPVGRGAGPRPRRCAPATSREADAIGLEYAQTGQVVRRRRHRRDPGRSTPEPGRGARPRRPQKGWTSERDATPQVLARNKEIDDRAQAALPHEAGDAGPGLRASFEKNLKGPALDLALGLQDQNWARADAARLELERRSFITDDKVVNEILESQYTRAQTEVVSTTSTTSRYRRDLAAVRGEHWDEKAQRKAMQKRHRRRGPEALAAATWKTLQGDLRHGVQVRPDLRRQRAAAASTT